MKNAKIVRPTLFNYISTREEYEHYANELFKMMVEDHFETRIHETYPLKDVARAHDVGLHSGLLAKGMTDDCARILRAGRPWENYS